MPPWSCVGEGWTSSIGLGDLLVDRLPALDLHAHIATDVTESQLAALGDAMVVAMTRSLSEAEDVSKRRDANLIWACGIHPATATAVAPI